MLRIVSATGSITRGISSSNFMIQDKPKDNKFVMKINGDIATVDYVREGNTYVLTHSSVPGKMQGKGYGHVLAERTFDYIVEKGCIMKLNCGFLDRFYQENMDKYKDYVI